MKLNRVLVPPPRRIQRMAGSLSLPSVSGIEGSPAIPRADRVAGHLAAALAPWTDASARPGGPPPVVRLGPAYREEPIPPHGYRLEVGSGGVRIAAADAEGLHYGAQTLVQLARGGDGLIPGLRIEDWPGFPTRGVMLDISRDKVPTLESLYRWVDWLSELKFNHLQLYTEHTFAYRDHPEVWADADPMTAPEIRALDRYCAERFVELTPNQNSFGHLRRWLIHPRYQPLAECLGSFPYPWGGKGQGPFSLNPLHPGSLELVASWYRELLPNFRSRRVNVGCDETFDLGVGASRLACEQRGKGRVYLEFLTQIHRLCRRHRRTMMFWGDIVLKHPEQIAALPADGLIALDWGYEADHPFASECAQFAQAGIPFWVCPGTSSWLSLVGRSGNCRANLAAAADQGQRFGAGGFLVTDWGDEGHWQPIAVSDVGLAAAATAAWSSPAGLEQLDLGAALSMHRYRDPTGVLGWVAVEAGTIHEGFRLRPANRSVLYQLLVLPRETLAGLEVTSAEIGQARERLEAAEAALTRSRAGEREGVCAFEEWVQAIRLARHGCRRAETLREGTSAAGLALELDDLVAEQARLWRRRNREGGLADSLARFARVRAPY